VRQFRGGLAAARGAEGAVAADKSDQQVVLDPLGGDLEWSESGKWKAESGKWKMGKWEVGNGIGIGL